jgi:hypothetical protein
MQEEQLAQGARAQPPLAPLAARLRRLNQRFEDKIVIHKMPRWAGLGALLFLYLLRVCFFAPGGFYVVTYALSLQLLYCIVLLITPLSDPTDDGLEGVALPSAGAGKDAEYKPFLPKVQEFKLWLVMFRMSVVCFLLTFFEIFDLPVYWPVLVIYFIALFVTQMSERIRHMMKHRYVPWNAGKPKFVAKD